MMKKLKGKKTYAIASVMVLYAVAGVFLDKMTTVEAMDLVLQAMAFAGLRMGMAKK